MGEIIFVILLAGGMIGSGVLVWRKTGYWHLLAVFLTFFFVFGLLEWHATATTGMSVSQQVWQFSEENPTLFWIVIGLLITAWLSLMVHFSIKRISKR